MSVLNVCLVQCDLIWENPSANRKAIQNLLYSDTNLCDLIVLPEMFTTGFIMKPQDNSEDYHNSMETLIWMKEVAKEKQSTLMGSVAINENGKYYNRMFVVSKEGAVESYDKKHLFSLTGENEHYTAGDKRLIFEINGWKIQAQICYDLRFPVTARNTINNNLPSYDLIVYSANWPDSRIEHWKTLLSARAVENQAFAIGVNRTGKDENGLTFNGESAVYDFNGLLLSSAGTKETALTHCTLQKKEMESYRKSFPFLWDQNSI